jgi:hypothetical protein
MLFSGATPTFLTNSTTLRARAAALESRVAAAEEPRFSVALEVCVEIPGTKALRAITDMVMVRARSETTHCQQMESQRRQEKAQEGEETKSMNLTT